MVAGYLLILLVVNLTLLVVYVEETKNKNKGSRFVGDVKESMDTHAINLLFVACFKFCFGVVTT